VAIFVYLRFCLAQSADLQDFEGDMQAMAGLAESRPGHVWSELGRSMGDPTVYVVVSEWDEVDDVRRWEHEAAHVEIQKKWEPLFREPPGHRRFTPWERPTPA
jgi:heme-degrading monooxygenase HmoA